MAPIGVEAECHALQRAVERSLAGCARHFLPDAYIFAHWMAPETNRSKIVARLLRDGWQVRSGGSHDVFKHPMKPGRIVVPRHRTLSPGVVRVMARMAGWKMT